LISDDGKSRQILAFLISPKELLHTCLPDGYGIGEMRFWN
jgi:hypothetical protein